MTTTVFTVSGRDLPLPWRDKVGVGPEAEVEVTLRVFGDSLNDKLESSFAQIGAGKTHGPFET